MTLHLIKFLSKKVDFIAIAIIAISLIAVISTYFNWGWISVSFGIGLPLIFILNVVLGVFGIFKRNFFYTAGIIIYLICSAPFYQISIKSSSPPFSDSIDILTFNVRGFNSSHEIKKDSIATSILKFIDSIQPDILLLQESDYKISRKIKGYDYEFLGYKENVPKSLLAINSKYPIVNKGFTDFPNTRNNGIYVDVLIKNDTVRIYNIHLQSHKLSSSSIKNIYHLSDSLFKKIDHTFDQQTLQSKIVRESIDDCKNKVIVSGDFNTPPNSLPYRILQQDLNDSYSEKGQGLGTTYSLAGYPLRVDYFLVNQQINILNHKNFQLKLSDHEPILVTFRLSQQEPNPSHKTRIK